MNEFLLIHLVTTFEDATSDQEGESDSKEHNSSLKMEFLIQNAFIP
jgi:hypothetical protein